MFHGFHVLGNLMSMYIQSYTQEFFTTSKTTPAKEVPKLQNLHGAKQLKKKALALTISELHLGTVK